MTKTRKLSPEAEAKWQRIRELEATLPEPVERDSRICYGVVYLASEEDAQKWDAFVRERGDTYNGGWFDGLCCGREPSRDIQRDGRRLYAVTTR